MFSLPLFHNRNNIILLVIKKMVLEGRLELPRIAPLAPQASASAIPPLEHICSDSFSCQCLLLYTFFFICQAIFQKKSHFSLFFPVFLPFSPFFSHFFHRNGCGKQRIAYCHHCGKGKQAPHPVLLPHPTAQRS